VVGKWFAGSRVRHDRTADMSLEAAVQTDSEYRDEGAPPPGELRFVSHDEAVRLHGALDSARLLVVSIRELGPGARRRLGEAIDDAIEQALRDRGGAPPGIGALSDRDAALSDQLYRARKVGRVGLALDVGPLGGLVDACGALDPDDAATLKFLSESTRDRPLVLMLDQANADVRAYSAPEPLAKVLGAKMKEAPTPTPVSVARPVVKKTPPPMRVVDNTHPPAPRMYVSVEPIVEEPTSFVSLNDAVDRLTEITRTSPLSALERAFVEGYVPIRAALLDERLGGAGIGRAEARALCTQFASTFARAYAEALPTFGVTGRHPRMIFELFDLAQRCARVHGARSTHVILVDALRFDLAKRVRERLGKELSRQAVCVEEHALWSILPTTTSVQLDALVRGEDALRAPARPERETATVRGRSLDVLRRMRLGHRDVVKLDLLEGRLRDAGAGERTRLDALADELTPILAKYIRQNSARAMVVVAGDHGFAFGDADENRDERAATPPARQGGGSPDEVFVPFQAWLVGGVH
jgi:hypothetical protein